MAGTRVKFSFLLVLAVIATLAATTSSRPAPSTSALPRRNFTRRTDYFFARKPGDKKRLGHKRRNSRGPQDLSDEDHTAEDGMENSFSSDARQDFLLNEVNTRRITKEDELFSTPHVEEEEEIVHPLLLSETFLPPPPPPSQDPQQLTLETSGVDPVLALPPFGKSLHLTGVPFLSYAPSYGDRIPPEILSGKSFSPQPIHRLPHPPLLPPQRGPPPPPPPPPPPHRGRSLGPQHIRGRRLPPLGPPTPAPNNPPPIYRHHTEIKQLEGGKSLQMKAPQHYFDDRTKVKKKNRYAPKYPRHNPLGRVRTSLKKGRRGKSSRSSKKKSNRRKSSSKKSYRTYSSGGSRPPTHPLLATLSRPHQRHAASRGRGYTPCHGKKSQSCHLGPRPLGLGEPFRSYSRESRHFREHSLKHHSVTVLPFVPVIPHHGGRFLHGGLLPYGDFHHAVDGGHGRSKSLIHGPPGPERRTVVVHTRRVYQGLQRPTLHVHERVNFVERHTPYLREHYGYVSHSFDPLPGHHDARLAKGVPLHHGFKY